ncbi:hypothetical protein AN641_08680 [Candidatus Epulonipiscioides gigas]|nr:hypothetical protein AN641_08680 [Epulopiscium sp. SCG-C07WGA-EpuloA2]
MKTLLIAINAKYIHSNLAIHYIKEYCNDSNIKTLEFSINQEENQIINQIYKESPDIIGFSCYIWNISYIKNIIPTIKKILPNIKIILGGPEVSFNSEYLLDVLPIDMIMEGEGELTWKKYLGGTNLSEIGGIIYKENNQIIKNPKKELLKLANLPFVYKTIAPFQHKIIYYEASRGCPFNCSYCISSIEKGIRFLPIERVIQDLDYFLLQGIRQVKFVDRTFNANKNFAFEIWKHIIEYDNNITNFHFEIAAELITNKMLTLLKSARAGLMQFEIGVQTTNKETLQAINRPMSFEKISEVVKAIKELNNIHLHLDLIVGLPYENYNSFGMSFNDVILLKPEQLQVGFLKVLKGSQMEKDATKFGIIYKSSPPYEVLSTNYMSYNDILILHTICELVERYYNTNRFENTLNYLFNIYSSPFDFFEQFAQFWEQNDYTNISHKKENYYFILLKFTLQNENINSDLIKELIKFDWLLHENIKGDITLFSTITQSNFKEEIVQILNDVEIARKLNVECLSLKQRHRIMRVEYFKYNVAQNLKLLDEPAPIVFFYEYGKNKARWLNL